jgi:hypothetical protein
VPLYAPLSPPRPLPSLPHLFLRNAYRPHSLPYPSPPAPPHRTPPLSKKCLLPVSRHIPPPTPPPPLTLLPRFLVNLVRFSDFYLIYFTYQKRAKLLKAVQKLLFALYLLLLRNTYCPRHFTPPPHSLPHPPFTTSPFFEKSLLPVLLYVFPRTPFLINSYYPYHFTYLPPLPNPPPAHPFLRNAYCPCHFSLHHPTLPYLTHLF